MSALDATTELLRHRLHPIADAEHWNAQREDGGGRPFGAFLVRRQMTARQDDPARAERPYEIVPRVTRVDLAIHARLAYAPRDQLRVLRAEVQDQDALVRQLFDPVIRRFLGDPDVVNMRLTHAGAGDLDDFGPRAHLLDGPAAAIAHAGPHAAGQLIHDGQHAALVRNHPLDSLGHQLVGVGLVILEIAVGRSLLHRPQTAHAAVGLVRAAFIQDRLAGRLFGAREHAPHHHAP